MFKTNIYIPDGKVSINNAEVIEKDISADNGVLHVIDDVMIPTNEFIVLQEAGLIGGGPAIG